MAAPSTPTRRPTGTLEAPTPPCMSPIKVDETAKPARVLKFPDFGSVATQDPSSYEEDLAYQMGKEYAQAEASLGINPSTARRPPQYPGSYHEDQAYKLGVEHGRMEACFTSPETLQAEEERKKLVAKKSSK